MISNTLEPGSSIYNYVRKIADNIGVFTKTSEEIFIGIGNKLQNLLTNSRELSKISSMAATSISDEIIKKGISELNLLLNLFSGHLNNSTSGLKLEKEELQNIIVQIELITDELKEFKKIVRRLKMLGISTKIESSRLGSEDNGFYLLAEQVDSLSRVIFEKAAVILEKAGILSGKILKTRSNLVNVENEQHEQSEIILKNITSSLQTLTNKSHQYFSIMENISNNSERISHNINDIVMSIQFHDITRQQMEHVKDVLLEAGSEFDNIMNEVEGKKAEKLGYMHDVCELQVIQLKNSINEFRTAVEKIITGLKGVEDSITNILNTSLELILNNDTSTESSYKYVQAELASISAGLINNIEIEDEMSKSITSVIMILDDLANYLMDIEDLGTEIEIIALNASIKAAHIGSNGLTLGVLAEAIQSISQKAKSQTLSTSEILKKINSASKVLVENNKQNDLENKHHSIFSIRDKIAALLNAMIQSEKNSGKLSGKLQEMVKELSKEVKESIEDISVLSDSRDSFDLVIDELMTITRSIQQNDKYKSNREYNIKEITSRYTMQSERQIHHNYAFKNVSEADKSPINDEDHYNDNVELF